MPAIDNTYLYWIAEILQININDLLTVIAVLKSK